MVVTSSSIDRRLRAMPVGRAVPVRLNSPAPSTITRTPASRIPPPRVPATAQTPPPRAPTPPPAPLRTVNDFDFNRRLEDQLNSLERQRSDLQQQNSLGNSRLREDHGRQVRDLRRTQEEELGFNDERMASQGILRSGIAVRSAGDIGARFGNELDSLQRQLSNQLEDRTSSLAQGQRQIQEQIGQAQEQAAREQQALEQERARQSAAAAAAQRAAQAARPPTQRIIRDAYGRYSLVDPEARTSQSIREPNLNRAISTYGAPIEGLQEAASFIGGDYMSRLNALVRRLGGNINDRAIVNPELGFRPLASWE